MLKDNKKKIVGIILVIFAVFISSMIVVKRYSWLTFIEITQLQTNTPQQMMGYFIKTKDNKVIIVDGGNRGDAENLEKYIKENGGKVDYWFITHFHTDHSGALAEVIETTDVPIDNIVCKFIDGDLVPQYEEERIFQYQDITNALNNERVKDKIITPTDGQIFYFDDKDNLKVKILSVCRDDIFNNLGNNSSMVFKLYINNKTMLFLGDTGVESSAYLLEHCKEDLKSDYVQMAHHGQQGATFELYQVIDPSYCFWPTPDWLWDNDLGEGYNTAPYKTIETREWMDSLNVKESYVEKDGDVTVLIK